MRSLLLATAWLGALAALAAGRPWLLLVVAAGTIAASLTAYRGRRGVFLALAALGVIALAALAWRRATAPPPGDSVAWWADGERHVLTGRIESAFHLSPAASKSPGETMTWSMVSHCPWKKYVPSPAAKATAVS